MFLFLLILWFIFNGKITLEITLFGIVICGGIYFFMCRQLNFSPAKDLLYAKQIPWAVCYFSVLVWEIVKANMLVIRLIGSTSKAELEPVIVSFDADLQTKLARVLLANSITLTPGTITVGLSDNHYEVHCLDKELAAGMNASVFVERLQKLDRALLGSGSEKGGK